MGGILKILQLLGLGPGMTESYIEVIDILTGLRDSRSEVSLSFQGDTTSYPSVVTAISPKHRVMVVEHTIPEAPLHLQRGRPVTVTTNKMGRKITFNSKYLEPLVPDLSLGYQLSIPEAMGTKQPRGALRVLLDEIHDKVKISLIDLGEDAINGIVKNISRSGVGLRTEARLPKSLKPGSHGVECRIMLQEENEIACQMDIRNVQKWDNNGDGSFIGGRILNISGRDSKMLSNFIAQIQRQHVKAYA